MAYFLSANDLYRVLQRELPPDNVYPDGEPSQFFSTADQYSVATVLAEAYVNLQDIYLNFFPETTATKLVDWEIKIFGTGGDSTLTNQQRIDRILAKIRSRQGIREQDMIDVVHTVIDPSILVEIGEWGCESGGWHIGESMLAIETYLNEARMLDYTGPTICCPPHTAPANLADMQEQAYTYSVLIYGYTLTATQRAQIDAALDVAEPARSQHVIYDGLNAANAIGGNT